MISVVQMKDHSWVVLVNMKESLIWQ
jgi:hypothetical protein